VVGDRDRQHVRRANEGDVEDIRLARCVNECVGGELADDEYGVVASGAVGEDVEGPAAGAADLFGKARAGQAPGADGKPSGVGGCFRQGVGGPLGR
jgi:hypothetical protein